MLAFEARVAETGTFKCILRAMYRLPYEVKTYSELKLLTNIAEYYCALPVVSATLSDALLVSPMFEYHLAPLDTACGTTEFIKQARKILFLARKLRHAALFRDAAIVVVGNWTKINDDDIMAPLMEPDDKPTSTWREHVDEDGELGPLVRKYYDELRDLAMECHHNLLELIINHDCIPGKGAPFPHTWEDSASYYKTVDAQAPRTLLDYSNEVVEIRDEFYRNILETI